MRFRWIFLHCGLLSKSPRSSMNIHWVAMVQWFLIVLICCNCVHYSSTSGILTSIVWYLVNQKLRLLCACTVCHDHIECSTVLQTPRLIATFVYLHWFIMKCVIKFLRITWLAPFLLVTSTLNSTSSFILLVLRLLILIVGMVGLAWNYSYLMSAYSLISRHCIILTFAEISLYHPVLTNYMYIGESPRIILVCTCYKWQRSMKIPTFQNSLNSAIILLTFIVVSNCRKWAQNWPAEQSD